VAACQQWGGVVEVGEDVIRPIVAGCGNGVLPCQELASIRL
jgi:hypothetical protein